MSRSRCPRCNSSLDAWEQAYPERSVMPEPLQRVVRDYPWPSHLHLAYVLGALVMADGPVPVGLIAERTGLTADQVLQECMALQVSHPPLAQVQTWVGGAEVPLSVARERYEAGQPEDVAWCVTRVRGEVGAGVTSDEVET